VSTILEALRERDGQGRPGGGEPIAWRDDLAWMRWRWPAAAIVALVAIGAVLHPVHWLPRPPPPSSPVAPSIVVQQPVRPALPPPRNVEEPPRARVERWKPIAAPPSPSSVAADAASTAAPIAPTFAGASDTPAESTLRVESIRYTEAPGERTVALAIDGAPSVSLRQGESTGGVEVQLILPGAVYLRRGPDVFALGTVR
jgi:hypothetical protein